MSKEFLGSIPTESQIEKLRLILSTYQDGTGQLARKKNRTLPGWRDFERSVALAFNGIAQESKAIFDVLAPISFEPEIYQGISCKMRKMLRTVERTGRVTIEVSNSSGKFWNALREEGFDDYDEAPAAAGKTLIDLVESWHKAVSLKSGGNVDISKSFYLVLQWEDKSERYQLYQYPIQLPEPESLIWIVEGRRLIGQDEDGVLIEWYGHSGGQLKYYPFADEAIWLSEVFRLEPLPESEEGYGILRKVKDYFPELWQQATE